MKSTDKYTILRTFDQCVIQIEDILSDRETNNHQLFHLAKQIMGDKFDGVYCSDDQIKLKNNQCCIVNTDSHKSRGMHWLAIYKYRNKCYVFDSFARDVRLLSRYFRHKHWINVEFNRIESYHQSNCGQLSLAWLIVFDKFKTKCIGVI